MDYNVLRALIETHPQWPSVTSEDLLTWGSDPTAVTRDRELVSADAIYGGIDPSKFQDTNSPPWWAGYITPNGGIVVTDVANDGSGATPNTRTASAARTSFTGSLKVPNQSDFTDLIPEQVSRFDNLNLFGVRVGDIDFARTL